MSKQPPNNNNNNQFDSDLEAIENAMNSIMQGAFSSMFRQLIDSSIFENSENNGFSSIENNGNSITTVFDGRNVNSRVPASTIVEEDGYGGSDFKQLAKKSKENRGITPAADVISSHPPAETATSTSPAGLIFNLLFQQPPAEIFSRQSSNALPAVSLPDNSNNKQSKDANNGGWTFNSTSSRTVYQPDGTQETTITKKSDGVTEIIKQIRYADGHTEETRETKNSFWNRLFGSK